MKVQLTTILKAMPERAIGVKKFCEFRKNLVEKAQTEEYRQIEQVKAFTNFNNDICGEIEVQFIILTPFNEGIVSARKLLREVAESQGIGIIDGQELDLPEFELCLEEAGDELVPA